MKAVKLKITGRVQGVFYRAWLARQAGRAGIEGWVRNMEDGSVEALLQGDSELVDGLVEKCKNGSELASVSEVEVEPTGVETEIEGFSVLG